MPPSHLDVISNIAFSMASNRGVFALLLGSGISRAAQIPTGWEITIDLVRRIANMEGVSGQDDWESWYRDRYGSQPNYSTLIEKLGGTPAERRAILEAYIEPSTEEQEEGVKTPTAAHKAIARLVRSGIIKVIVTTNFDRLLDNALRDEGVEPTVVSSEDHLAGAEPITHCQCYILKLHGDYKDSRILNTDEELSAYPENINKLLDRIIDEYGLLVSGWSGEWDAALRSALLRAPNRRYSTYWTARHEPTEVALSLLEHRRGKVCVVDNADTFFGDLEGRIAAIMHSETKAPEEIEQLIVLTKRFLAKSEYRIQLEDLLVEEKDKLVFRLKQDDLFQANNLDADAYTERRTKIESATEPLAKMIWLVARWSEDPSHANQILDAICRMSLEQNTGSVRALHLRFYPAVLLFTMYGLGLVQREAWPTLFNFFRRETKNFQNYDASAIEALNHESWGSQATEWWQCLSAQKWKRPVSVHMRSIIEPWSQAVRGLADDFERLFGVYEILSAVAYGQIQCSNAAMLENAMKQDANGSGFLWVPVGSTGFSSQRIDVEEYVVQNEAILNAGFANGDRDFLDLLVQNYERLANRVGFR